MHEDVEIYKPKNVVRVITATSLFDGHDASTNIMRRILQDSGVEVIHLAHNRSVQELVDTAIEEDAQGIAMSSYQGGHVEAFKYMIDLLKEKNASHIKVFGGGGGVIVADEIKELEAYGVTKIYSPEDGASMGLQGMINHMIEQLDFSTLPFHSLNPGELAVTSPKTIGGFISAVQQAKTSDNAKLAELLSSLEPLVEKHNCPVIGITGTGGAGKSSLTDEIIVRFLLDIKDIKIAIISCDPTRRKTGGALLGDRIRMNSISGSDNIYMRSLATQSSATEVSEALPEAIQVAKGAGFDLIIAETAGIGQGDSKITDIADISIYVMTSEFGAPSQLEKIDMLDYADLIVVNKFEKKGSEDAFRDIRKQVQRNRKQFATPLEEMPVYGTIASKFNDDGVTSLYHGIIDQLADKTPLKLEPKLARPSKKTPSSRSIVIPSDRLRYLSEISSSIRKYHGATEKQAKALRAYTHLSESARILSEKEELQYDTALEVLKNESSSAKQNVARETEELLTQWQKMKDAYAGDEYVYSVRNKEIRVPLYTTSLSHLKIPKLSLPRFTDPADIYSWMRRENLPGYFPYTGGVFPLKRTGEDPTRMFAGEGGPAQTNARFKLLSGNYEAKRLSTAFDSVTLYGWDPAIRPDIYGKVGTSGVSICSLDDVKLLYDGFELCSPTTSVSMTINGPAPIILAMFMNTAIDQQIDHFVEENDRQPTEDEYKGIKKQVLTSVRGTVQADILKEDQGQNTCIFSIEFALKMMGDIQEYFIANQVKNFYSVSVSGYHIAEAGANPITQLALTLSNGFTYVEYYLSRGMDIDQIAPNLSFFFSNGMDPEYTVIGRVARRIWAVAMKEKYGASTSSQRLKYHIQTSGRSLHSQDIQFNDIRTTLQALCAIYDNCNSLHTNAYDEAITTPSSESVRRALAIQMIINREWGLAKSENPNQGSFVVEELTDLVEEAVLAEFDKLNDRGGVLGAMETGYQRSKIQEESMYYEHLKHSGEYPIIGVNTFRNPDTDFSKQTATLQLARATKEDKDEQIARLDRFHKAHEQESEQALARLREVALSGGNIFAELLDTVKSCSLGQICDSLYKVGGQYRRNM
ncbi:fused isobutyryl-CoA mutase/GTPase IcmF [Desulforhopalus singaporensis]|uniref:Fused isobutyryl-CoA mutase n=1 Tax=Desulforhopalus singaporensis TaxID=91360 RepID=A0A1H0P1W0_9BACT|nr:fused isobutyryl-CoA mutase/GTPase IcmF [Desulforhopalus singaporensis]SDO98650.1 methylmalonyl-CoA mutase [Desulforhopalus singaporensis]